uniref:EAL and HDOD domain-containing protein n=1 Tax=Thaumasiovibrio occultus TaxID=1891184 RepID=UPI000B35745C|nr:HDOD domain-containing protein [Thaumasiovibrio occultus]
MHSFVARQPILNRQMETIAYELLFRDGPKNAFPEVSAEYATSRLLIDRLSALRHSSEKGKASELAFINFPHASIVDLTPTLFPKNEFVIEMLESCEPNEELYLAVQKLWGKGYTLALDDFNADPAWERFLPYIKIIKFDLKVTSIDDAKLFIDNHRYLKLEFLAEKVETKAQFHAAAEAGFDYFQGYFFAKPELIKRRSLSPSAITTMRLYKEISQPEVDFAKVEEIVSNDVSISYKLLRYVNTMTTGTAKPVNSFKQALVYLGEERVRRFVYLVATAYATKGKNHTLYRLSIQRARFCETMASKVNLAPREAFLTGLFSMLDSLLDSPLDELVEQLPLTDRVKSALVKNQGRLGGLILLARAYDRADWPVITRLSQYYQVTEEEVAENYMGSLQWTQEFIAKSQ